MSDNMAIWNAHSSPPKEMTKPFKKTGGFSGTAIEPMWLIRACTELWGPMGGNWGIKDVVHSFHEGAENHCMHMVELTLFHPHGEIRSVGQTMFIAKNKNGLFTDEEAPKKSMTDAISKALSWLGFGADIYMGLYDGNKCTAQPAPAPKTADEQFREDFDHLKDRYKTAANAVGVEDKDIWEDIKCVIANWGDGTLDSIKPEHRKEFLDELREETERKESMA
jgi:hypothetical protein